jgi:hypothetical protein
MNPKESEAETRQALVSLATAVPTAVSVVVPLGLPASALGAAPTSIQELEAKITRELEEVNHDIILRYSGISLHALISFSC